ncbi:FeoB-associated Cys-rich membrane protein [Acetivibrio ethanolgignens]|uniref:FeoB-associated Cys-rich membrane protein n=1 Tax=Acetivibrio ethanolgignens TaxID=290052 RepID=UPI0011C8255D|nr:FeoB-associated Cys-rich membrane protein [Acetivibrio ethanolgignens]
MVEILIITVLVVYCGWVVTKKIKDIKAGKCSCGCSGCDGCSSCREYEKLRSTREK